MARFASQKRTTRGAIALERNQLTVDRFTTNSTVWENSFIKDSSLASRLIEFEGIFEVSTTKVGLEEAGFFQNSLREVSSSEIAFKEESLKEYGLSTISSFQINSLKNSFGQSSLPQVSTAQVGIFEMSPLQASSLQIRSTEDDSIKFFVEQANSLEVQTPKIPLPSSVTLQQFLSSHNFNLQNTTIPTWTEFLTGTTPFNLNIEIIDLPTGQLAEATITRFDPTGLPTSGTLTLDDDANGLDWFIDSTPWDNTEFGTQNGDSLFRATLGSAAYGRYDLLTTVLHELGHLAGIIHGPPTYDDRVQTINGSNAPFQHKQNHKLN